MKLQVAHIFTIALLLSLVMTVMSRGSAGGGGGAGASSGGGSSGYGTGSSETNTMPTRYIERWHKVKKFFRNLFGRSDLQDEILDDLRRRSDEYHGFYQVSNREGAESESKGLKT